MMETTVLVISSAEPPEIFHLPSPNLFALPWKFSDVPLGAALKFTPHFTFLTPWCQSNSVALRQFKMMNTLFVNGMEYSVQEGAPVIKKCLV